MFLTKYAVTALEWNETQVPTITKVQFISGDSYVYA